MDNQKIARELLKVARELTASPKPRKLSGRRFAYVPVYEFGVGSNDVHVYSDGKIIGQVEAKNIPRFDKGNYGLLDPISGWRRKFSVGLIEELGLG